MNQSHKRLIRESCVPLMSDISKTRSKVCFIRCMHPLLSTPCEPRVLIFECTHELLMIEIMVNRGVKPKSKAELFSFKASITN